MNHPISSLEEDGDVTFSDSTSSFKGGFSDKDLEGGFYLVKEQFLMGTMELSGII